MVLMEKSTLLSLLSVFIYRCLFVCLFVLTLVAANSTDFYHLVGINFSGKLCRSRFHCVYMLWLNLANYPMWEILHLYHIENRFVYIDCVRVCVRLLWFL